MSLATATEIVKACVCLHNFIKTRDERSSPEARCYCPTRFVDYEDANGIVHLGEWRSIVSGDSGITALRNLCWAHNFSAVAGTLRDRLSEFFVSPEGAVPWQEGAISTS